MLAGAEGAKLVALVAGPMAGDDMVPLRDYVETRIDHMEKLREQDRTFYLEMSAELAQWREQATIELASVKARMATIAAVFAVIISLLQLWRGAP